MLESKCAKHTLAHYELNLWRKFMSDTIIAAIIGAVTTIIVTIFGALVHRRYQAKKQSSIYDEHSSHSFVAGFVLTILFNNMCSSKKLDSLLPEINTVDTALKNAGASFKVSDNLPDVLNVFKYQNDDKNRFIAVGELANKWPDAITKHLQGKNSYLFTLGTILTSPLYSSAMSKEQLAFFDKKISIAFNNTGLPKKFYSTFRSKMKKMEKSNFSKADYKKIIESFSLKLISYLDDHKKESH